MILEHTSASDAVVFPNTPPHLMLVHIIISCDYNPFLDSGLRVASFHSLRSTHSTKRNKLNKSWDNFQQLKIPLYGGNSTFFVHYTKEEVYLGTSTLFCHPKQSEANWGKENQTDKYVQTKAGIDTYIKLILYVCCWDKYFFGEIMCDCVISTYM